MVVKQMSILQVGQNLQKYGIERGGEKDRERRRKNCIEYVNVFTLQATDQLWEIMVVIGGYRLGSTMVRFRPDPSQTRFGDLKPAPNRTGSQTGLG